jgi:hypothetical protein
LKIRFARVTVVVASGMLLAGCAGGGPAAHSSPAVTGSAQPAATATQTPVVGKRLTTVSLVEGEAAGLTFRTDPVVDGMMRTTVSCRGGGRLHLTIKNADGSTGATLRCDAKRGEVVMVGGVKADPSGLEVEALPSAGARWWLRVETCAKGHCPQLLKRRSRKG